MLLFSCGSCFQFNDKARSTSIFLTFNLCQPFYCEKSSKGSCKSVCNSEKKSIWNNIKYFNRTFLIKLHGRRANCRVIEYLWKIYCLYCWYFPLDVKENIEKCLLCCYKCSSYLVLFYLSQSESNATLVCYKKNSHCLAF